MTSALAFAAGLVLAAFVAGSAMAEPVTLVAADKVKVFAEYSGDADKARPVVLLFHQASSNAGEYATIAPRLNALGFNALALDQRSGGSGWGRENQTAKGVRAGAGFEQVLPDLEAALDWARASGRTGKVVLWGSSYSASLVFLLAAKHPGRVAGILAFSPGEYLGGGGTVRAAAAKVAVPIFVSSASDPGEIAAAKAIIDASPAAVKTQFRPKVGTHGSSTLRLDRNPAGAAENWQAVEGFLARLK
ncbi:alpha/beta fold hydrolase [Bosea sp. 124]|uniref:alpha/beta hydrolase n=1 Tax=Bosea sp. 124 TaxID=2135642 RepID=UPI000D42D354|nr:alpha/beta fold hydrolase [Bosea sp. 124]PTM39161.1 serine aminopeptidase S33 family [Bosea sp. 124]